MGAASSNWEIIVWTDPLTVSLDTSSIAARATRVTARVMWDYAEPQTPGGAPGLTYWSMIGIVVFDCATLRFGGAGSTSYSGHGGDGERVAGYAIDPDTAPLGPAPPGSVGRELASYVCDRAKSSKPASALNASTSLSNTR